MSHLHFYSDLLVATRLALQFEARESGDISCSLLDNYFSITLVSTFTISVQNMDGENSKLSTW